MFLSPQMNQLSIQDLRVSIAEQEIIRGLSLAVPKGEVHAIMGPNCSGKSTLAKVLAGHPDYKVVSGKIEMDGENIMELEPDERARKGLFLAFQYPSEIPGVTIANFLRAAVKARLPKGEEGGGARSQFDARPGDRHPCDHPLSAAPRIHRSRSRSRHGARTDRAERRKRIGVGVGRERLRRLRSRRGIGRAGRRLRGNCYDQRTISL